MAGSQATPHSISTSFMSGHFSKTPCAMRLATCPIPVSQRSACVSQKNVGGHLYALHNRCPHRGGALCLGPVTGTALGDAGFDFVYGREGELIRCAWHGWEFEIATGRALADAKVRAKTYPVEVEDGGVYVLV